MNETFKHSYKQPYHENIGLVFFSCGYEGCLAGHQWGPAVRDHYLIHYIDSGKGTFTVNNQTYHLSEGDGFLLVPGVVTSYTADKDDPWQYRWVGFGGSDAQRMVAYTALSVENPVFRYDKDNSLAQLMDSIYRSSGSAPHDEAAALGYLHLFLSKLMELSGTDKRTLKTGFDYVDKAIRYIERNYANYINVDDIAASAGISRSHLYRLFMQNAGMSPNEYLNTHRINVACTLMRSHGLTVCEAANSCGFSDQLYFSRVFKKMKGMSPSYYIKATEF